MDLQNTYTANTILSAGSDAQKTDHVCKAVLKSRWVLANILKDGYRNPTGFRRWGKAARSMKQEVHWLQTIGSSQCPQSMVKLGRRNEGGFITWNSISRNLLNLW